MKKEQSPLRVVETEYGKMLAIKKFYVKGWDISYKPKVDFLYVDKCENV